MQTQLDPSLLDRLNAGLQSNEKLPSNELDQEGFFELMIAQFQNQDPTKPTDGAEYFSQLTQISTAQGIAELKEAFEQLAASMQSVNAIQASSMVGRDVVIETDQGYLGDAEDAGLSGSVNLETNVNNLTMVINDASGQEIRRLDLGDKPGGRVEFNWDGLDHGGARAPEGVYQIRLEGMVNGTATSFTPRLQATVQSVSMDSANGELMLNLAGLGQWPLSGVSEIL